MSEEYMMMINGNDDIENRLLMMTFIGAMIGSIVTLFILSIFMS